MSRSYRRPWITDNYGNVSRRRAKKWANREVRRFKGAIADGGQYRKIFCSWDICDYRIWAGDGSFRAKYSRK